MQKQDKTKLEIGDRLYSQKYGHISGPYIIERVTPTQAIAKHHKFRREISGNRIKQIGEGVWNTLYFSLETPEILEAVRVANIRNKVCNFKYDSLTIEKMEAILKILSE